MKRFIAALLVLIALNVSAQTTVPISSMGIGEIKVNTKLPALKKILGLTTIATKLTKGNPDDYNDTIHVTYKNMPLTVVLVKNGGEHYDEIAVYSVSGSDSQLKTKSGIGIGADKFDVVRIWDGYDLHISPDWRKENPADKKRFSTVVLNDYEAGSSLILFFDNNKLYAFEVSLAEEGC